MEVTAGNFELVIPSIERAISRCDFVAIDCEFTGLDVNGRRREEYFDDLEQRYARVRMSAQHFLVIQVGLSLFEWCPCEQTYRASTYNCYVYPRPHGSFDLRFTCQASSLEFLSKHNFDFNKFIYEGVPFINLSTAEEMYAKLEQQASAAAQAANIPSTGASAPVNRDIRQALRSEEDKQRHRDIIDRVREWLEGDSPAKARVDEREDSPEDGVESGSKGLASDQGEAPSGVAPGERQEREEAGGQEEVPGGNVDVFVFEPMNSFWRAVVYQTMEREFGKGRFLIEKVPQSFSSNLESLRLVRSNPEAVLEAERVRAAEKRARLDQTVGFSRVLRALSAARKPLVGHNMLLDLAYIVHLFVQPLPPAFADFRDLVASFFSGGIFDTKHLALQVPDAFPPFAGTALEAVFAAFRSKVQRGPRPGSDGDETSEEMPAAEEIVDQAAQQVSKASPGDASAEGTVAVPGVTVPCDGSASAASAGDGLVQPEDGGPYSLAESLIEAVAPPLLSQNPSSAVHLIADINDVALRSAVPATSEEMQPAVPLRPVDAMPSIEHEAGFTRYLESEDGPPEYAHEAGFDAFMTGVAFVGLAKVLEARREKPDLVAQRLFRRTSEGRGLFGGRPRHRQGGPQRQGDTAGPSQPVLTSVKIGSSVSTQAAVLADGAGTAAGLADSAPTETGSSLKMAVSTTGASLNVTAQALVPPAEPASAPAPLDSGLGCLTVDSGLVPTVRGPAAEAQTRASDPEESLVDAGEAEAAGARELQELVERTSSSPVSLEALRQYSYRINLMGSDMPHLPLQGPLIIPERGHLFHISGFSEETRSPEIAGRFADLGLGAVDITWIDRSSAIVALRNRALADTVIDSMLGSGWDVDIARWADFRLQAQCALPEPRGRRKDDGAHAPGDGTAQTIEASQPRKGRRLNGGERQVEVVDDEDAERDGRRAQKALARRTCSIL
ncbi:Poly(A)-specific exoribonuclease PARN [Klebsormidium nitens]|uniref:Poly(A)-specific exoribonuclease PARN n=1 Tax=Klebsormidium nitens TaxID=105231 RepID=A0A1Y1I1S0_KLENI|nr:Poly(A)-specific exoribonuclease PARN [Klebsormidium nitens]|eukprot:GAQ84865.1 Poly(A)-specific exoribonuclease PARN [Klebsormidium nitens]